MDIDTQDTIYKYYKLFTNRPDKSNPVLLDLIRSGVARGAEGAAASSPQKFLINVVENLFLHQLLQKICLF